MKTFRLFAAACIVTLASTGGISQVPEPRTVNHPQNRQGGRAEYPSPLIVPSSAAPRSAIESRLVPRPERPPEIPSGTAGVSATFLVTTANDTGAGSLREAIAYANSSPGADLVRFQIPGGGLQTIAPQSPLPVLTGPVTIDGTSAPGYFGQPLIQIDGTQAGISHGFEVEAAACSLRGLSITRFSFSGIAITGAATSVEACYIGVEPDGFTAAGNGLDGITIVSANNRIGRAGGLPNVISGNGRSGIMITGTAAAGNIVVRSYVGTNWTADGPIPNGGWGIDILNAEGTLIGGTASDARNILSGNAKSGIGIRGAAARNVTVQGNFIGTGADSRVAIPNTLHGVEVAAESGISGSPSNVVIGGRADSGEQNVISGNSSTGVAFFLDNAGGTGNVVAGNHIGVDVAALDTVPNTHGVYLIRPDSGAVMSGVRIGGVRNDSANVIAGNRAYGIWLSGTGARNNLIRGNYIGITPGGGTTFFPRPNLEAGILLRGAARNEIGGPDTLSGNVIGSNIRGGIALVDSTTSGNTIINNYIGTAPGRTRTIGNGLNGVYCEGSLNVVGRVDAGNIITHNAESGIFVLSGVRNSLRGNSIYRNGTMGIDLSPTLLTPNDTTDADTGPNTLVNYPIIDSIRVTGTDTYVDFHMIGAPSTAYAVDFYGIDTLSASLFGEGKIYLGSITVTTLPDGTTDGFIPLPLVVSSDLHVTAMATDPAGNSSEFCRAYCLKDTDGDGLHDCWETPGIGMDVDMNGLVDLDLYLRGGTPDHKDIFVEVDRMADFDFHPQARDMCRAFFAAAPNALVQNPDGRDGVNLLIKYDPSDVPVPRAAWGADPWVEFHAAKKIFIGSDLERAHPNGTMIIEAKRRVFRYCIFADRYGAGGSSGIAQNIVDNDFIVTLGNWNPFGGTVDEQAGTFIHELGHTLGLRHGGADDVNYKPNYLSVMNYLWQFPRPDLVANKLTWKAVYSPTQLDDLNEANLNDKKGLNVPKGSYPGAVFLYGNSADGYRRGVLFPGASVDWNGDSDSSTTGGVARDLNGLFANNPGEVLKGHADWPALVYDMRGSPTYADPAPGVRPAPSAMLAQSEPELTFTMRDSIFALPPYGLIPALRAPSIVPGDTGAVGGNRQDLRIVPGEPAPAGGITYHLRSTAPDILTVPPTLFLYQGSTEQAFAFETRGVDRDTVVYVAVDSLEVPLYASVLVRPASLLSFAARGDSGCTITEQGGFRKKYLAGCRILFEAGLDGEAPPAGGIVQLTSSRPDLIDLAAEIPVGSYARHGFVSEETATVSSPQAVILTATYRGTSKSDTVTIMPAPQYTFADISQPGRTGYNFQAINNAGEVLIDGVTLLRNGSYVRLDTLPGFLLSGVSGMNDLGWFCGTVWDTTLNRTRPAYWKPDTTIVLPSPDPFHPQGGAVAINNLGEIVGGVQALPYPYEYKPVVWKNDIAIPLEGYFDYTVYPVALNDSGQIVGGATYYRASPYTNRRIGVRWDGGVLTPLFHPWGDYLFIEGVGIAANGTAMLYGNPYFHFATTTVAPGFGPPPPHNRMVPYDMNDSLEVVGELRTEIEDVGAWYSAFVEKGGLLYDLKCLVDFPPGWDRIKATGINNSGTIVGVAEAGGEIRLFLLTPGGPADAGEEKGAAPVPAEFRLFQNYPNPFNPATVIRYGLPQAAEVTLEVYSILGQRVRTLVDGRQTAGTYEVKLDGSSLASGVYIYRLRAGAYLQVRKMMLVK